MALRHQRAVWARSGKRPHFSPVDRCFWGLLSTIVVAMDSCPCHRASRHRPRLAQTRGVALLEVVASGEEARTAGYYRRDTGNDPTPKPGECALGRTAHPWRTLAMLGIMVSCTTVAKYMTHRPGPPSQTWRTFLRNHACELIAGGVYADMGTRIRARLARMIRAFQHRLEERSDCSSRPSLTRDGVVPVLRSADVLTRPLQSLTHTNIHA